jgi:hypothetical protein
VSTATTTDDGVGRAGLLVMAAALEAGGWIRRDHIEAIHAAYDADRMAAKLWDLVLAGEVGVSWDEAAGEPRFRRPSDEEVDRRRGILADVAAGRMAPPWPDDEEPPP